MSLSVLLFEVVYICVSLYVCIVVFEKYVSLSLRMFLVCKSFCVLVTIQCHCVSVFVSFFVLMCVCHRKCIILCVIVCLYMCVSLSMFELVFVCMCFWVFCVHGCSCVIIYVFAYLCVFCVSICVSLSVCDCVFKCM